jgi:hypothetical protein
MKTTNRSMKHAHIFTCVIKYITQIFSTLKKLQKIIKLQINTNPFPKPAQAETG